MRYLTVALILAALAGCRPAADAPPANDKAAPNGIDYAGWPELTKRPLRVDMAVFMRCSAPPPGDPSHAEALRRGPHYTPTVRVYANDLAAAHLREDRLGPLPLGSTVVKVKWWDEKAAAHAYAAMVKR